MSDKELIKRQIRVSSDFKDVFESDAGQRVLKYLKYRFWVDRTTVADHGMISSSQVTYREGSRAVILHIQDLVNMDLEAAHQELKALPDPGEAKDDFATE